MPNFPDYATKPFGTSTNAPTVDLDQIKLFGCTVVDFNVSADWSSQGGSLSCRLIESETDGDRLIIPVLGRPVLFELRDKTNNVLFQYIGIVDSFSRNASNSKTYSVNLSSPLKILDATTVILDGYVGLGSSIEGLYNLGGLDFQDFGHNNSLIDAVTPLPGVYRWHNVSNLINVYAILENDDIYYRYATSFDPATKNPLTFGGYGHSGKSKNGMPLIKLMWALHVGINHVPPIDFNNRQRVHGGNLLFGRHNYYIYDGLEAIPFYYHFDAINFYNQVVGKLGPEYRVEGQHKTLNELISAICNEANLEYYSYIDLFTDPTIGNPTLLESDLYEYGLAQCSWPLNPAKFTTGGNYGGTIRIQTIDKNAFLNLNRPFSNIAYNLIGLEVPDIRDEIWKSTDNRGIHPGRRPVNDTRYGVDNDLFPYSDPLDSIGISDPIHGFDHNNTTNFGSKVGTESIAGVYSNFEPLAFGNGGGVFPVSTGIFDWNKTYLDLPKIKNSDISIKLNDVTTMKVITGGYQSRIVTVPGNMLRHYWGDIIVPNASDPREVNDVATDPLGLNENSTRKIPVVTPILHPRDVDDYILIDMQTIFGQFSCDGVIKNGIYAASMLEIRCAMRSEASWKAFIDRYKYQKIRNLLDCFYPGCGTRNGDGSDKRSLQNSTEAINLCQGLGYVGVSNYFGLGNSFSLSPTKTDAFTVYFNEDGTSIAPPSTGLASSGAFGLGIDIGCAAAEMNLRRYILPAIFEKVKSIGDTHYGKSWYAPVPYSQTIEDLDGENLIGNFKRSWELTDSAYIEPASYYSREVPQNNTFVSDGKISAFINYDHNFVISGSSGVYDKSYAQEITSLIGQTQHVFNFSEYDLDQLCITRYGSMNVIHAAPENIEDNYTFLPFGYDILYNRAALPFSNIITGQSQRWKDAKSPSGQAPLIAGQSDTENEKNYEDDETVPNVSGVDKSEDDNKFSLSPSDFPECPGAEGQIPEQSGYFEIDVINGMPALTNIRWLNTVVPSLQSLIYSDNGRFSFPFIKFTSSRVFLPVPSPASPLGPLPSFDGFNAFVGSKIASETGDPCARTSRILPRKQFMITEDQAVQVLNPFQACVAPRSFSYPQISTRYVYGPWMTSLNGIIFRGKIEYEQDDSLVPENFLIPINYGPFGNYELNQTSGFTGMNLAAQGRANAIDNFGLFALEEGSITVPGAPAIKRIGDSLYGVQQITDIKISISNDTIETSYSFKTISPKFGKNTRDLEKKLTKISNDIKKLKLR
jgi:hypothetical protein